MMVQTLKAHFIFIYQKNSYLGLVKSFKDPGFFGLCHTTTHFG